MPRETGQGNSLEGHHEILGGIAHIYQVKKSGEVWQFRMWLSNERKHYRKSLRTRVFRDAMTSAEKLALELRVNIETGKKVFGITVLELFDFYIENREKDIGEGDGTITLGTWKMLKYKIQHGVEMLGHDTKVANVRQADLEDYRQRRTQERSVGVQQILNEQSQLNAMFKYAYRKSHIPFEKLNFRKIKILKDEIGRRDTFSMDEYNRLIKFMRKYVSKKHCPDDEERLERLIIRDYVFISTNTCARVGEIRQMRWKDVLDFKTKLDSKGKEVEMVKVRIRAETSKSKISRERITCTVGR